MAGMGQLEVFAWHVSLIELAAYWMMLYARSRSVSRQNLKKLSHHILSRYCMAPLKASWTDFDGSFSNLIVCSPANEATALGRE